MMGTISGFERAGHVGYYSYEGQGFSYRSAEVTGPARWSEKEETCAPEPCRDPHTGEMKPNFKDPYRDYEIDSKLQDIVRGGRYITRRWKEFASPVYLANSYESILHLPNNQKKCAQCKSLFQKLNAVGNVTR